METMMMCSWQYIFFVPSVKLAVNINNNTKCCTHTLDIVLKEFEVPK